MTVAGQGVTARLLAWNRHDVIAVEIDDERAAPEPINLDLRMLRYAVQGVPKKNYEFVQKHLVQIRTAEHTATSRLEIRGGAILLTQQFAEKEFFDQSAVGIQVLGRASRARYLSDSDVQLSAAAGRGRFTILISSAATFDRSQDVAQLALAELEPAVRSGFDALLADNRAWWKQFWSEGSVELHSADGQADYVGENYRYFLYLMGSSSRGKYPPRFGGMLWYTNGDMRRWGSQYWWANTSSYYNGLIPAGRWELMDPLYSMYTGMYDSCALAAKQQWGSEGIWIPEIVFFDGLEKLPDDIAAELQDLMLVRKPYSERSAQFQAFAEVRNRHHSRWNFEADGTWEDGHYVVPTKGHGIFGHCTHILGSGVRIASLYWDRYQYTLDPEWLRTRAYPMLRGMAEFYRHFPNFQKGPDGVYHLNHINNGEQKWDTSDSVYETNCLHLIFPLAIRAAQILGVDPDLQAAWAEVNAHLVPPPGTQYGGGSLSGYVYPGPGAIPAQGIDRSKKARFLNFEVVGGFVDPEGAGGAKIFRNRLRLREGPGATDAENLGALTGRIHAGLLTNVATPGADPVLQLFNDWPSDWDARFTLIAPGAFTVTASQRSGRVEFAEFHSGAGAIGTVANPWGQAPVQVARDGRVAERLKGGILQFKTRPGETVRLTQAQ